MNGSKAKMSGRFRAYNCALALLFNFIYAGILQAKIMNYSGTIYSSLHVIAAQCLGSFIQKFTSV